MAVLAALVAASALLPFLLAGSAVASVDSSERTLGTTEADPGQTVEVTVEVRLASGGDRLAISDDFSPAFEDVEITETRVDGESTLPVIAATNESFVEVGFEEEFSAGDTVTLVYEVTVPGDAPDGQLFGFDGEAAIDDSEPVAHEGDGQLGVGEAGIAVTGYDLDSTEVATGETVAVGATVANGGDDPANLAVNLQVDGETVATEEVALGGGESRPVTLETAFDAAGSYEVTVNDLESTTVTVEEREESTGSDEPTPSVVGTPVRESGDSPAGTATATAGTGSTASGTDGGSTADTAGTTSPSDGEDTPGFGVGVAVLALLAATALAVARRRT